MRDCFNLQEKRRNNLYILPKYIELNNVRSENHFFTVTNNEIFIFFKLELFLPQNIFTPAIGPLHYDLVYSSK